MKYEVPIIEVVGPASDLIQNYMGPAQDGDGEMFSQGSICSTLEEQ